MAGRKSYMFTSKNHSLKSIMAVILGILSIGTLVSAVYLSYKGGGISSERYGAAAVLAGLFMIVGMGLSVHSLSERDTFKLFPVLGTLLNFLALCLMSIILYAGAYVN